MTLKVSRTLQDDTVTTVPYTRRLSLYLAGNVILIFVPDGIVHEIIENEEFMDKTDFNIRSFVYPL